MSKRRERWFSWLSEKSCVGCGAWPVEIAHVQMLMSPKTGLVLPRREGIAIWGGIPLCVKCHRTGEKSIHAIGETAFWKEPGRSHHAIITLWASWFVEWVAAGMKGK